MSLQDYHEKWMDSFKILFQKTIYNHVSGWDEHRRRTCDFTLWPPVVILTVYTSSSIERGTGRPLGQNIHASSSPLTFTAALVIRMSACYGTEDPGGHACAWT